MVMLEKDRLVNLPRMGIASVTPGSYATACGKGYGEWACAHGEPNVLELKHDAIDFFADGSADAIFYWDSKARNFRRIQMSD